VVFITVHRLNANCLRNESNNEKDGH
jgi:hypothetical protein